MKKYTLVAMFQLSPPLLAACYRGDTTSCVVKWQHYGTVFYPHKIVEDLSKDQSYFLQRVQLYSDRILLIVRQIRKL